MTIERISAAPPLAGLDQPLPVPPPPRSEEVDRFAALLAAGPPDTPQGMLQVQAQLGQLTLASDLTARVAGSLTQAINKLVNLQ